jgi:hypothetical protein
MSPQVWGATIPELWINPSSSDSLLVNASKNMTTFSSSAPTGAGKSFLACALAHKACREGYRVLYFRLPRLLQELSIARVDGRYGKLLWNLAKTDILVIDDLGLQALMIMDGAISSKSWKTAAKSGPRWLTCLL